MLYDPYQAITGGQQSHSTCLGFFGRKGSSVQWGATHDRQCGGRRWLQTAFLASEEAGYITLLFVHD